MPFPPMINQPPLLSRYYLLCVALLALLLCQGCTALAIGKAVTGATVSNDRRTIGTVVEDTSIPRRAVKLLNDSGSLSESDRVQVDAYNEVVLLTGEVADATTAQRVTGLIEGMPKVDRVVTELEVAEPAGFWRRRSDGFLATRVKTSLFGVTDPEGNNLKGFDPRRVKVVVARGNVYLMGLVSRYEADQAADRAANTRGAKRVIKVFDYTD